MGAADHQGGFEALYARFADPVLRYAVRRVDNAADAEDIVAETFAICWRRLGDVPAGKELAWLYGVARRVLANQRRARGRMDKLRSRLEAQPVADVVPPDDNGAALDVLAELSEADQEILRLALWEELTPAEIAVALGISENAVYIRLHRARQRFAAAFEKREGGEQ